MTIEITHPQDALTFIRKEFPLATMDFERGRDGVLCGYWFILNKRSKTFVSIIPGGGVDLFRVRLFRDGAVYARDKAKAKRAEKARIAKLVPLERNPWLKTH